jgi:hypothetical protein
VDIVERYAFLWDGSEPGWTVERTCFGVAEVVAHFPDGGPSLADIKALRDLDETLGGLPVSAVYARLARAREVELGRHEGRLLRRIQQDAAAAGIRVSLRAARSTWYALVHRSTGRRITLDDESDGQRLFDEARRRGLPVGVIEAD